VTPPPFADRLGHAATGVTINALSLFSLLCLAGPVVAGWFPVLAQSRPLQVAAIVLASLPGGAWCLRRHAQQWRAPQGAAAAWALVPYAVLFVVPAGLAAGLALVGGSPIGVGFGVGLAAAALGPLATAALARAIDPAPPARG
jgi:hypothetical protein